MAIKSTKTAKSASKVKPAKKTENKGRQESRVTPKAFLKHLEVAKQIHDDKISGVVLIMKFDDQGENTEVSGMACINNVRKGVLIRSLLSNLKLEPIDFVKVMMR